MVAWKLFSVGILRVVTILKRCRVHSVEEGAFLGIMCSWMIPMGLFLSFLAIISCYTDARFLDGCLDELPIIQAIMLFRICMYVCTINRSFGER